MGFQNSQIQNGAFTGTNDWKKLTLKMAVDTNVNKLVIGAYLEGNGSVWLDDVAIEELPKTNTSAPKKLVSFGKDVTNIIKNRSMYADSIDFKVLDKEIEVLASDLNTDDTPIIMDHILSKLRAVGDKHSLYQSKTIANSYAIRNNVVERPTAKLLEGNVAYISVPAFASTSDTASVNFATHIHQLLKDMDTKQEIKGWVVDLRRNGGGNMYPMMAGLGPLIGEGTIGYFVDRRYKNSMNNAWTYHAGSAGINGSKGVTVIDPYDLSRPDMKIAVLIGSGTGSSGEMTALSFVGKPNVRLFGNPTAGYITANQGFKLSSGGILYLATSYVADRNKKQYWVNILPDVEVSMENRNTVDNTLDTALQWLQK